MAFSYNQPPSYGSSSQGQMQYGAPPLPQGQMQYGAPPLPQGQMQYGAPPTSGQMQYGGGPPQGQMQYPSFNSQQMQEFMIMQSMLKGGKTPSTSTPSDQGKKKYVQRKDRPEISIRLAKEGGIDYDFHKFDITKLKFTIPEVKLINPDDPSKGSARRGEVLYNYGTVENPNWKPFKLEGPIEVFKYGVGERDRTEKVDGVDKPTGEKEYSVSSYMDKNNPEHVEYMKVLTEVYVAFCRFCYFEPKCGMKSMADVNTIDFTVFNHDKPCTNVKSLVSPEKDKTPEKNIVPNGVPRLYSKCNPFGEWRCIFTDSSDPPVEIDLEVINNSLAHGWCLRSYSGYSIQGQGPAASISDRFQSMVIDHLEEKGRTHQQSGRIRSLKDRGEQKNLDLKDQIAQIRSNILLHKKQAEDLKRQVPSTSDEKSEDVKPRDNIISNSFHSTNLNSNIEPTGRGAFHMEETVQPSMRISPPPSTPSTSVGDSGMQVNTFGGNPPGIIAFNPQQQEYYAKMAAAQLQSQSSSDISKF